VLFIALRPTRVDFDVVVLGSDGVFDNLFLEEIVTLINAAMPLSGKQFEPTPKPTLRALCEKIIIAAHDKPGPTGREKSRETPIGPGGKVDDCSVVVAEIVEWTEAHSSAMCDLRRKKRVQNILGCFVGPDRAADCMSPQKVDEGEMMGNDYSDHDSYETESEDEENESRRRCFVM